MKDWILKQIKTYRKRAHEAWVKKDSDMQAYYNGIEYAYTETLKKILDEEIEQENK